MGCYMALLACFALHGERQQLSVEFKDWEMHLLSNLLRRLGNQSVFMVQ